MKRFRPLFLALGAALALSGSIAVHATDAARSGFLDDYSKLKPNPKHPGSSDWIDQSAPLKKYNAMIIDPVTVRLGNGLIKDGARPDPKLLNEVLAYLRDALEREFSKHMTIVKRPGENVLHYRAAITGITTKGGVGSSAMNILPVAFVLRTVSGRNDVRAHLFMEAEYSDSLTGAPVGATMQSAAGGSLSGGSSGDARIRLDHLKGVLDQWAAKAAEVLNDTLGL